MRRSILTISICSLLGLLVLSAPARAQVPVRIDIELATEPGSSPTVGQQWYQTLTALSVSNLRLRSLGAKDEPKIDSIGTTERPAYKVLGVVTRDGDLLLPGGKFRATDREALTKWLTRLRDEGPDRAKGGPPLPLGLTKEQFALVHADLAAIVDFSTAGLTPGEFLQRCARLLKHPLHPDPVIAPLLAGGAPLDVELRGLSVGTATAYLAERNGLALVPHLNARRQPTYAIRAARQGQDHWPVGWPATTPARDLLPPLFEIADVEITDVEISRILAAISEHIAAPILVDEATLARDKIDLSKIKATLPAKKSMYEVVLRKILVPKMLTHQVRVDEADHPFIWITTARQAAPTATPGRSR